MPHPQRFRRWLQTLQVLVALRAPTILAAWIARHTSPAEPEEVRSILVVRMDGIGDSVLTLPLIERLRICLPQARITVLTREELAAVFRMSPSVDEVLALPRTHRRVRLQLVVAAFATLRFAWQQLRGRSFDAALSPRYDVDVTMATLLTALSRAPIRVGYEDATSTERLRLNRSFHLAFTHVLPAGRLQHEALRATALADPLGCSGEAPSPRMVSPAAIPAAISDLQRLHPGTALLAIGLPAGSPHRRWPASHFIETVRSIRTRQPIGIVLISDNVTAEIADAIADALPDVVRLPTLTLQEVAAALAACDVFLGSDTGIGHIAAAVGCAMVTLSPHPEGADPAHTNSPVRFRPFTPRALVLQPAVGRPGCEQGCESSEAHCILDVTPLRAAEAVISLLSEKYSAKS